MNRICREAEAALDYYTLFKAIMKRAPVPMSPLESLASSAVRTAHKVTLHAQCPPPLSKHVGSLMRVSGYLGRFPLHTRCTPVLLC